MQVPLPQIHPLPPPITPLQRSTLHSPIHLNMYQKMAPLSHSQHQPTHSFFWSRRQIPKYWLWWIITNPLSPHNNNKNCPWKSSNTVLSSSLSSRRTPSAPQLTEFHLLTKKTRCLLKVSAKPTFRISELGLNGWASISTQVLLAWRALLPIARHILIVVQQGSDRAHGLHTNDLVRHEIGDVETPVHWAHRHVELVGCRLRAVCTTRTRLCYWTHQYQHRRHHTERQPTPNQPPINTGVVVMFTIKCICMRTKNTHQQI